MAFKLFPKQSKQTSFLKLSTAVDKYVRKLYYFPIIKQILTNFGLNNTQDMAQTHHPIETFQLNRQHPVGIPGMNVDKGNGTRYDGSHAPLGKQKHI